MYSNQEIKKAEKEESKTLQQLNDIDIKLSKNQNELNRLNGRLKSLQKEAVTLDDQINQIKEKITVPLNEYLPGNKSVIQIRESHRFVLLFSQNFFLQLFITFFSLQLLQ